MDDNNNNKNTFLDDDATQEETVGELVLLVSASGRDPKSGQSVDDRGLLFAERKRSRVARYVDAGGILVTSESMPSTDSQTLDALNITPADEIALTDAIVRRSLSHALNHDFDENNMACLSVLKFFPLHDKVFNGRLVRFALRTSFVFRWPSSTTSTRVVPDDLVSRESAEVDEGTLSSENDETTYHDVQEFLDLVYRHFGLRVAIYFAFIAFYTKRMIPIAVALTVYYALLRFVAWDAYVILLAVVGGLTTILWGPLFVRQWRQENERLLLRWNVTRREDSEDSTLAVDSRPNPHHPEYVLVWDERTKRFERQYDPHRHRVVVRALIPFLYVNSLSLSSHRMGDVPSPWICRTHHVLFRIRLHAERFSTVSSCLASSFSLSSSGRTVRWPRRVSAASLSLLGLITRPG